MGTWGSGIFEDDVALDVRGDFEEALEKGASPSQAADRIMADMGPWDEDDGPVAVLALADLLLEAGHADHPIIDRALAVITRGEGLNRWESAGMEALSERQRVYQQLAHRVEVSRLRKEKPSAVQSPSKLGRKTSSRRRPFKEGDIVAVPLELGGYGMGIIARVLSGHAFLGYFYGPRKPQLKDIDASVGFDPSVPAIICECSDLGFTNGGWKVVGQLSDWNSANWPIPAFGHIDVVDGGGWVRKYADDGKFTPIADYRVTPEEARALPEDGAYGYVALERRLAMLLGDKVN